VTASSGPPGSAGSAGLPRDLPQLLAAGERAAFHGPPGQAVPVLEQAVALAQAHDRGAEATAARWLLGVALGACGRYVAGLQAVAALVEEAEVPGAPADRRLFGALAAGTGASLLRQLGRHAEARLLDQRGLALADTGAGGFDCRLGLAADAVGLGDADEAEAQLAAAAALMPAREDWWRQRVRLGWVRAELALLRGQPAEAVTACEDAVARAERAQAPRHVAKGLLFLGVSQVQTGSAEAAATLRRAATLAESLGALPLVWPSRAVLGALLGAQANGDGEAVQDEAARSLEAARGAIMAIAGQLSDELREAWLRRPDVAELLVG
jgi:hypothetical protein